MYNNDYIIAVDENGQPYIAHANGEGNWLNRAVKYIDKKIGLNGKVQYVYDRAKKAGKKAWGSKAGRWIDSHDAGISERLMAKRASRLTKKYAKKGDKAAAKYYAGRSMALNQESARERNAAKDAIRKRRDAASLKIRDKLGEDERARRDVATSRYMYAQSNKNSDRNEIELRRRAMEQAKDDYNRTVYGRIENIRNRIRIAKNKRSKK